MDDQRAARFRVVSLGLVDELDDTARYLGHLALDRRPAVILVLGDHEVLVDLRVGYAELATGEVRATLALDVAHADMVVADLVVRPVTRAFARSFGELSNSLETFF